MALVTSEERIEYLEREINDLKEALSLAQAELEELALDTYKTKLEEAIEEKISSEKQAISQSLKEEIDTYHIQKNAEQLKITTTQVQELENKFNTLQKQLETTIQNHSTKAFSDLDTKASTALTSFTAEKTAAIDGFITEKSNTLQEFRVEKSSTLNKLSTQVAELEASYEKKLENLIRRSEEVLAIASSAALSTSFNEEKNYRKTAQNWSLGIFALVIVLMVFIPVALYYWGFIDIENWKERPQLALFAILKTAALEWPLIWIAKILSKKMQLQQRIYEEYAHKYAAALAYSAMRKDIKELHDGNYELAKDEELKSFTENLVAATFVNPSRVFDTPVSSEHPLEDIRTGIKDIASAIEKWSPTVNKD